MTFRLYEPAHWRQMGDNGPLFLSKARAHITQNLIFHFNVACSLQIVLLFNDVILFLIAFKRVLFIQQKNDSMTIRFMSNYKLEYFTKLV